MVRPGPVDRTATRGQILPLIALTFSALLGFGGMAVDVGSWEYGQRQQQNAVDAAALGGAQQLGRSNCVDSAAATAAGQQDATTNGYSNGGNVTVTIQNPPSSGPYAGDACAVDATIKRTGQPAFFTRLFGYGQGATITTHAVAVVTGNNPGCIYYMDPRATVNLNGDVILAPKCAVYANSADVETLASVITVKKFGYAQSLDENLLTIFLGAQPKRMLPATDPCPEIAGCAYLAGNPPSTANCHSYINNSLLPTTVNPGCYSDFENNLGILTMNPGLYTFTGPVNNTGVLMGNGVTMYVSQTGGPVGLNGSVALLAPPTSGNYAGVLLYQTPGNTNTVHMNAAVTLNLAGLLYAPNATAEILGQANVTFGKYMIFVVANTKLLVNATLTLPGPDDGMSLIKGAALAE
jgi:hypothetical protein